MYQRKMQLTPGWYPGNEKEMRKYLDLWAKEFPKSTHSYDGAVLPHAGWYYSGHHANAFFQGLTYDPDVILIFGGHQTYGETLQYWNHDSCETPFGEIPIDGECRQWLKEQGAEKEWSRDNSIEVFLPFLSWYFPGIPLVALRNPPGEGSRILELKARVAELYERPLVIASADLTHFGPAYGFAPEEALSNPETWVTDSDHRILDCLEKSRLEDMEENYRFRRNTCSPGAMESIHYWFSTGSERKILRQDNSLLRGTSENFVGYGSVGFKALS